MTDRRPIARKLAAALIQRADKLMYDAKGERANHIYLERARVLDGELAEWPETPVERYGRSGPTEESEKVVRRIPSGAGTYTTAARVLH